MSPERYWQGPEYWTETDRVGRMGQLTERTWRRFIWILVFLSPLHSESGATSRREKHTAARSVTQRASTAQCLSVPCSYTLLLSKLHTISKVGWGCGWGWGVGWVLRGIIGMKLPFTDITLFSCDLHAQVPKQNSININQLRAQFLCWSWWSECERKGYFCRWAPCSWLCILALWLSGRHTWETSPVCWWGVATTAPCGSPMSPCSATCSSNIWLLGKYTQCTGEEWPPLLHAVVPHHLVQQPVAVMYGCQVSTPITNMLVRCAHHWTCSNTTSPCSVAWNSNMWLSG